MAKVKGRDLIIFLGGTALAYQKECSMQVDCDIEEMASATDSEWKEYFTKRKSWKMSNSSVMPMAFEDLDPVTCIGQTVQIAFALSSTPSEGISYDERTYGSLRFAGNAIITSAKINGSNGGNASWSLDFQGTGALSIITSSDE